MSQDKLNEAIAKAKSGDKAAAGKLLAEYVREDPSSETAWLWLSICVSKVEQKRLCLNKALAINPHNEDAKKALEKLDAPPPPAPSFEGLSGGATASSPETLAKPPQPGSRSIQSASISSQLPASSDDKMPAVPMEKVGGYVRSILMPNEKVLATARIHWVIYMSPTIFTLLGLIFTIVYFSGFPSTPSDSTAGIILFMPFCCIPSWLIGLIGFIVTFLRKSTTEFALTNKRVIGKRGVIRRNSLELVLEKVESIRVDQGILGRILDYGTLVVTGSGGTDQLIPFIAEPMELKKTINAVLAELR